MSQRERMIGMAVGAALCVLLLDTVVFGPLQRAHDAMADQLTKQSKQLLADQKLVHDRPNLEKQWSENLSRGVLYDKDAASAQLASSLQNWANETGVVVVGNAPAPNAQPVMRINSKGGQEKDKYFQKVVVKFDGTGSMAQVGRFIWRIQTADIPVRIEDYTLTPTARETTDDLKVGMTLSTVFLFSDTGTRSGASGAGGSTSRPVVGGSTTRPTTARGGTLAGAVAPATTRAFDPALAAIEEQLRARRAAAIPSTRDVTANAATEAPTTPAAANATPATPATNPTTRPEAQ